MLKNRQTYKAFVVCAVILLQFLPLNHGAATKKLKVNLSKTTRLKNDHRRNLLNSLSERFQTPKEDIHLEELTGGRSRNRVFKVHFKDSSVYVLKIFDNGRNARQEFNTYTALQKKRLSHSKTPKPVAWSETIGGVVQEGLWMRHVESTPVSSLVNARVKNEASKEDLARGVAMVGVALREVHDVFYTGQWMSKASKASEIEHTRGLLAQKKKLLGSQYGQTKKRYEEELVPNFLEARIRETAYHGDANSDNFLITENELMIIDVATMRWSLNGDQGTMTGAPDIARFLESLKLNSNPKLSSSEYLSLKNTFLKSYEQDKSPEQKEDFQKAIDFYTFQFQLAAQISP